MKDNTKRYIAELFGTMILIVMGCGSIVFGGQSISHLEIALCFGITLTVLIYAIGPISGCHLNPAVSIAMLVLNKMTIKDTFWYILFQCLGAIIGSTFIYFIAVVDMNFDIYNNGLGQNTFQQTQNYNYDVFVAFSAELFLTAFFVFVIISTTSSENKNLSGVIIGLTLVIIHIMGISLTGVSVNPARSLGPAIYVEGNALSQLWIFIFAPICGGLIAAGFWTLVDTNKKLNSDFNKLIENK